jgi:hypothetical protein
MLWAITSRNELRFMLNHTDGMVGTAAEQLPYVPVWEVQTGYKHKLSSIPAAVAARVSYIGTRAITGGSKLGSAYLIDLEGSYQLSSLFEGFVQLRNLGDASYQIWQGYPERGIYGALGIRTRL